MFRSPAAKRRRPRADRVDYPRQTITLRYSRRGKHFEVTHEDFEYRPFARAPFLHAFEAAGRTLTFANAHLYRGTGDSPATPAGRLACSRRALEAYALARWAARTTRRNDREGGPVVVLGDLNIPKMDEADAAHQALVRFGLKPPEHGTRTAGTNLGNDATYDQIIFTPGPLRDAATATGVFDFDKVLFAGLWDQLREEHGAERALPRFNEHVRFHISDHRVVWTQLSLG